MDSKELNVIEIIDTLKIFFPGSFKEGSLFIQSQDGKLILQRIKEMATNPIHVTYFNQLLHLNHEAGVTDGLFKYYFLTQPKQHPYPVDKVLASLPDLDEKGISSINQAEWGLRRFYIDALLFWGDLRSAYRDLRGKSYHELESFFSTKRFDSHQMMERGNIFPFAKIAVDDRYLISEIACKAYTSKGENDSLPVEQMLVESYKKRGGGKVKIASLFDSDSYIAKEDPSGQMMLQFIAEEFMDEIVENEDDIRNHVKKILPRFKKAHDAAVENTRLFLSIVNELDIYVATSMRKREDFRNMATDCKYIFGQGGLKRFNIRYFDPTMSAAEGHEDKGLIECLMVKCAKTILYFAGDSDSFGKDAEIAMGMSLGKPVIILCPDTEKGKQREKFFRDIHPLSKLIHFDTGVAIGAMVTRNRDTAALLLERMFDNKMEYDLAHAGDGYFRLKERLTGSIVRLQTNSRILRETFWNYYHGTQ